MRRLPIFIFLALLLGMSSYPTLAGAATRSLSLGSSGADVRAVQNALVSRGYLASKSATGYFGPITSAAVKKFQCATGIICAGRTYGLVGPATRAALVGGPTEPTLEVTGWLPYWRAATSTADILPHLSAFTSVMPFGYIVQNDGSMRDAYNLGSTTAPAATLVAAARSAGVKIIPTVMWSNGAAIHAALSDPVARVALEDTIATLVVTGGFDGIDIDFEGKWAETKDSFSSFLEGLRARLGGKLLYCSIEARTPLADRYDGTPPADAGIYANDYVAINQHCDRVQLMTYDQQTIDVNLNRSAASAPYIPISDTKWVEKVVTLAAQTIAKDKLEIGIATYGYEWQVTPLSISGFRYDMQWAFNPRYATALATALGLTPSRNGAGEMSMTYIPSAASAAAGGASPPEATSGSGLPTATTTYSDGATTPAASPSYNILWWSDAQAIADKIALAKRLGVRGVAIFKIDGGEDQGLWAALAAK